MEITAPDNDWIARLNAPGEPVFKQLVVHKTGRRRNVFLPTARMVDDYARGVGPGQKSDAAEMKKRFAEDNQADLTCPVTMRIHLQTIAEAALEMHARGAGLGEITPFWRVMDENDQTAKRLSCGTAFIARRRAEEGL
jgi:hypothetical protein